MRKHTLLFFILFGISFQILSFAGHKLQAQPMVTEDVTKEVILFYPGWMLGNHHDINSYGEITKELNLSTKTVDHKFINKRESFFDKSGQRKFKVLILPGGEPYWWFNRGLGESGINCQGVKNILGFIKSGGSVIAICHCGSSLFSTKVEWLAPGPKEAQQSMWERTHYYQGWFRQLCGGHAFEGTIRGPQESNRPYPKTLFLPIKMNPENEIVREANLPPVISQIVAGGGSIIPDKNQPLDVVGWFPNGTAAIGIVPYGKGRIIMSNPHPNITGERAKKWRNGIMGDYAKQWGWTEDMIKEEQKLIQANSDPDGWEPDWALAKAMLSYAYRKASEQIK